MVCGLGGGDCLEGWEMGLGRVVREGERREKVVWERWCGRVVREGWFGGWVGKGGRGCE